MKAATIGAKVGLILTIACTLVSFATPLKSLRLELKSGVLTWWHVQSSQNMSLEEAVYVAQYSTHWEGQQYLWFARTPHVSGWRLRIPWWLPAGVCAAILLYPIIPWIQRRERRDRGCCIRCEYDLRGFSGTCPECGQFNPLTGEAADHQPTARSTDRNSGPIDALELMGLTLRACWHDLPQDQRDTTHLKQALSRLINESLLSTSKDLAGSTEQQQDD